MINYNIKGTELSISSEVREYLQKRLAHIEKMLQGDQTAHVDVELQFLNGERDKKYRAEFTLQCGSIVHRAEARGDALHEAIDLGIGELMREVRSTKKKRLHIFRHKAVQVKEFLRGWRNKI